MGKVSARTVTDPVTPAKMQLAFTNLAFLLSSGGIDENNFYEGTIDGITQNASVIIDSMIDTPEDGKPFEGEVVEIYDRVFGDAAGQIIWCHITNDQSYNTVYYEITETLGVWDVDFKSSVDGAVIATASGFAAGVNGVIEILPTGANTFTGWISCTMSTEQDDSTETYIIPLAYNYPNLVTEQYKRISEITNTYDYTIRSYDYQIKFDGSDVNGQLTNNYRDGTLKDKKYKKKFFKGAGVGAFVGALAAGLDGNLPLIGAIIGGKLSTKDTKIQVYERVVTSFVKTATFDRPKDFELLKISPHGDIQIQIADKCSDGNSANVYLGHSLSDDKIVFYFDFIFSEGRKFEEGENIVMAGTIQTFWRRKI